MVSPMVTLRGQDHVLPHCNGCHSHSDRNNTVVVTSESDCILSQYVELYSHFKMSSITHGGVNSGQNSKMICESKIVSMFMFR